MIYRHKSRVFKITQDWLGLDDYDTDRVVEFMREMVEEDDLDYEEMTTTDIRKLADKAFKYYESGDWK